MEEVVTSGRLVFGDYLVPGADPRVYTQVTDMARLVKVHAETTLHLYTLESLHRNARACLAPNNACSGINTSMMAPHTLWLLCIAKRKIAIFSPYYCCPSHFLYQGSEL